MNCKLLQAEIEKEVFEVQIKNVNKQLTEYTTDQINHTIALYIMKKCCEDGKISRTAYEKMTRKYENKILEKNKKLRNNQKNTCKILAGLLDGINPSLSGRKILI